MRTDTETEMELSEKGRAALAYVNMGLAVMPVLPNSKRPASENGSKDATTDREQVELAWTAQPDMNIAIVAGAASSNLVIIDCDLDEDKGKDGLGVVNKWQREHGEWPDTACVTTPHGGEHFYYRIPANVHNSVGGELGVDIRGIGGYAVAPPSVYREKDGTVGRYEWDLDLEDYGVSQANQSVLDFIDWIGASREGGRKMPFKLPDVIYEGKRNDTLFRYGCSLRAKGKDEDEILGALLIANRAHCAVMLPDEEVKKTARNVIEKYDGGHSEEFDEEHGKFTAEDEAKTMHDYVMRKIEKDGKKRPLSTVKNAIAVLNADPRFEGRFKYDEMAYTETVQLPLPWDPRTGARALRDVDLTNFYAIAESEYGIKTKEKCIDAIESVCDQNRYNPVRDWLDSLEWDGKPRVATLLNEYLGVEQTGYSAEVMDLFMRGAIARVLHPGCQFDYALLIQGQQGVGKSHFARLLAHDDDWFNGNMNTIEGDGAVEKLRGKWILEMSELLALKRTKEVQAVKSFITNQVDNIRPKFKRKTEDRPRVCVFIGTTNDQSFLSDPTGNRRFLVVESGQPMNRPADALYAPEAGHDIEQAWAEAYHEWKAGKRYLVLPHEFEAHAETERARFEEEDTRIGTIQGYLDDRVSAWDGGTYDFPKVCVKQLARDALGMSDVSNLPQRFVNEIHEIMQTKVSGWVRYPNNGGRMKMKDWGIQRVYVPEEVAAHIKNFDAATNRLPDRLPTNEQLEL